MILVFVLTVIISGPVMWIVAKIARVEKSSFPRAMAAAIATAITEILVAFLLHFVPVFGFFFGFIVGLVVSIFVIKMFFGTSFGKALLVWIFFCAAVAIGLLLATLIMSSSFLLSHGI
jgi:hypothetical protein